MPIQAHSRGVSSSRTVGQEPKGFSGGREIQNYVKSFNLYTIQLGRPGDTNIGGVIMLLMFYFFSATCTYTFVSWLSHALYGGPAMFIIPNPIGVIAFIFILMGSSYFFGKKVGLSYVQSMYLLIFSTVHIPIIGFILNFLMVFMASTVIRTIYDLVSLVSIILVSSLGGYILRSNFKKISSNSGDMDERKFYIREIITTVAGFIVNISSYMLFYRLPLVVSILQSKR
ncbi:hypothetical protein NEFER03_0850 [Nematocida sp. LUAm3]|nr:hypothetical protein NEFER03_0850 [Nematocida sp. LUAm3]KAI5174868.1 hypothetical protein NEFER02_0968 [Nematocida sp. LUAm2]KAI5177534.1 hypothetical protein NEFER01_0784 [Nematocida sp. LUAm1]